MSFRASRPIVTLSFSSCSVPSGNVSQMSVGMSVRIPVEETSDTPPNVTS